MTLFGSGSRVRASWQTEITNRRPTWSISGIIRLGAPRPRQSPRTFLILRALQLASQNSAELAHRALDGLANREAVLHHDVALWAMPSVRWRRTRACLGCYQALNGVDASRMEHACRDRVNKPYPI